MKRTYICIDLKSFYASVECVERHLDPLSTNLVVADETRTDKTICLAVSPSLKSFGIPGRARLFEVKQKIKKVNDEREKKLAGGKFDGESFNIKTIENDRKKKVSFIVAPPRMAKYIEVSTKIYDIYLKYVAPEDMHVYSVDEVFIDATDYLKTYDLSPRDFAMTIIKDVLSNTGITATVGIGTNLYLAKIAMDIVAKKMPPDSDGVRIAALDEASYRKTLWEHRPLSDFWRVGPGISERLRKYGIYTMGDIAKCSVGGDGEFYNEELLFKEFGINAELLIDHAWGYEPTKISDIKSYKPSSNSLSIGQVLSNPYPFDKARIVVKEMANSLALDLVSKGLMTDLLTLTVGYDVGDVADGADLYDGEIVVDRYGRNVPKSAHGSSNLKKFTCSPTKIVSAFAGLFDRIVDKDLHVRRMYVVATAYDEKDVEKELSTFVQISLFDEKKRDFVEEKDKKVSKSVLKIKEKYGKNSILKGIDFEDGATEKKRNKEIGGHKA